MYFIYYFSIFDGVIWKALSYSWFLSIFPHVPSTSFHILYIFESIMPAVPIPLLHSEQIRPVRLTITREQQNKSNWAHLIPVIVCSDFPSQRSSHSCLLSLIHRWKWPMFLGSWTRRFWQIEPCKPELTTARFTQASAHSRWRLKHWSRWRSFQMTVLTSSQLLDLLCSSYHLPTDVATCRHINWP